MPNVMVEWATVEHEEDRWAAITWATKVPRSFFKVDCRFELWQASARTHQSTTTQCSAAERSAAECSAPEGSVAQCSTAECSFTECSGAECWATECSAAECSDCRFYIAVSTALPTKRSHTCWPLAYIGISYESPA